jgi:hypothetical protein
MQHLAADAFRPEVEMHVSEAGRDEPALSCWNATQSSLAFSTLELYMCAPKTRDAPLAASRLETRDDLQSPAKQDPPCRACSYHRLLCIRQRYPDI